MSPATTPTDSARLMFFKPWHSQKEEAKGQADALPALALPKDDEMCQADAFPALAHPQ